MYLMTQTKNGISALELSRQLSVSYNTAWKVKHKLMQVMKERDDTRPLGGWVSGLTVSDGHAVGLFDGICSLTGAMPAGRRDGGPVRDGRRRGRFP